MHDVHDRPIAAHRFEVQFVEQFHQVFELIRLLKSLLDFPIRVSEQSRLFLQRRLEKLDCIQWFARLRHLLPDLVLQAGIVGAQCGHLLQSIEALGLISGRLVIFDQSLVQVRRAG